MSFKWVNNSLSIVLLPSEARYEKVHEQLKQWIGDGLLGNFIWMTADDIQREEFGPPTTKGTVWGLDEDRELTGVEVNPFEEMARNRFKTVRLIAVRVLSNSFEPDEEEYAKFDLLSDSIRLSLPLMMGQDQPGDKTDLRRINLVIYPTELRKTDYSTVFKGQWDHHVVASPEDRKTPLSADRFVKEDSRYPKFIAMHVAATGGLWNGIARSPFDDLAKPESGAHSYQLSRVFVNSVLTDGLSRRIAANVLSDIADPTVDLHAKGLVAEIPNTYFIEDADIEESVNEMVTIVFGLENGLLQFHEPDAEKELEAVRWTEWQSIGDFFKFSGQRFLAMPKWCWIWFRRRIGKKLQDSLVGPDGGLLIGIDQNDAEDIRDRQLFGQMETIANNVKEAQKALVTPFRRTSTTSRPSLWSDLRQLVYGFLEGGELTKFGIKDSNGRYPMFSKVSDVIQDPQETWSIGTELQGLSEIKVVGWANIDKAPELVEIHTAHVAERRKVLDEKLNRLVEIDKKIKELAGDPQ
ncbi:hypothetical protein MCEMRE182_00515 [Candidatus Nanopelagicaceae bacterium]